MGRIFWRAVYGGVVYSMVNGISLPFGDNTLLNTFFRGFIVVYGALFIEDIIGSPLPSFRSSRRSNSMPPVNSSMPEPISNQKSNKSKVDALRTAIKKKATV